MAEEGLRTTPNHLIHIGSPIPFNTDMFLGQLQQLMETAYAGDESAIRTLVEEVVPTYQPVEAPVAADNGEVFEEQPELTESSGLYRERCSAAV